MQHTDDVVSGWLNGSEDSPAGPLFIEGTVATEEALTRASAAANMVTTLGQTTGSCRPSSCACC